MLLPGGLLTLPSTGSDIKSELAPEPPKPTFSFAATMANLNKQAEAAPVKTEETRKPETPEEKQKRLRKEQRRKLRVSFKDDDLVQIREFVHDPEEELGHEDSQVRDVGDSRGEGQMLKMHRDLDLMDEDEDYEPPDEVLPDWVTPKGGLQWSVCIRFFADFDAQRSTSASLKLANLLETIPTVAEKPKSRAMSERPRSNESCLLSWSSIQPRLIFLPHLENPQSPLLATPQWKTVLGHRSSRPRYVRFEGRRVQ